MKTRSRRWATCHMVATLLMKARNGHEAQLLLGPKLKGVLKGFDSVVGGKTEPEDSDCFGTSERECKEESGYRHSKGRLVAIVTCYIKGTGTRYVVKVISTSSFTGRLCVEKAAFEWLRFVPLSRIPWKKFAPGEEEWMKRVLFRNERLRVVIRCGKDRGDLKSIRCYPMRKH